MFEENVVMNMEEKLQEVCINVNIDSIEELLQEMGIEVESKVRDTYLCFKGDIILGVSIGYRHLNPLNSGLDETVDVVYFCRVFLGFSNNWLKWRPRPKSLCSVEDVEGLFCSLVEIDNMDYLEDIGLALECLRRMLAC